MAGFERVPERLYSWIDDKDPFKITKMYQVKYWWNAFSDLYEGFNAKDLDQLVRVLSNEGCWRPIDEFYGFKLDVQIVGKSLITETSCTFFKKYRIACRCCLEDDIANLLQERRREFPFEDFRSSLRQNIRGNDLSNEFLCLFWLQYVQGRVRSLSMDDLHMFERGLYYAVGMEQPLAMEYIWNKIKSLPEEEMSNDHKEEILMKYSVYTVDMHDTRPEMTEVLVCQINPEKYPNLASRDLVHNHRYKVPPALLKTLRFNEFKMLFDCLKPCKIPARTYRNWLQLFGLHHLYGQHLIHTAVNVFVHVWEAEGFDNHRSAVLYELATNKIYQENVLVPFITSGHIDGVYRILDKASPQDINYYMNSDSAKIIRRMIEETNDIVSLNKFLSYQVNVTTEL